jgi:FkbM family methyltransferase
MRVYGVLVNDYYDGYVTNYDCREGIATYMNKVRVPIGELEKSGDIGLAVENGWVYDVAGKYWFKDSMKFRHMYWPILEVFDFGNYEGIDVNGKVVIDVGAFVGDTAIYFALKGARRIIAVEPHPGAYAEMLDNIRLNNLEGVIIPINAGLASKPGKICVENTSAYGTAGTYHRPGDCPNAVSVVTLSELMDRFGADPSDAVLKMDCEGCEFDVILNDYEHVKLFEEVVFEYHAYAVHRPIAELINTMSNDFNCQTINEDFYRKFFSNYSRDQLGLIRCVKRS